LPTTCLTSNAIAITIIMQQTPPTTMPIIANIEKVDSDY
jgi:hypothetical protein